MTDFVFLDSGLGGIPYMLSLLKKSPTSRCIYVADTKNFPYGEKSHEQVINCVVPLVQKICAEFSPSVIVLACNTISVNALEVLRKTFPFVQFVGTVPAIKLAAGISKTRNIGLLATKATCENPYNIELKNKFAGDCSLICRDDGKLVSFIEKNAFTASREEIFSAIKPAVEFFSKNNCDVMILGCTHFLNISDEFKTSCAGKISVVDSVDGVVRQALKLLKKCTSLKEKNSLNENLQEKTSASNYINSKENDFSKNPSVFVTGKNCDDEQYKIICKKNSLNFCGIF